eukprot:1149741-Pelagomonas_calceolata.AAC.1
MLGGPGPPGPLPRADRALSRRRLAAGAATAGAFSVAAGVYHHRQASRKNKELSGGYVLAPTPRFVSRKGSKLPFMNLCSLSPADQCCTWPLLLSFCVLPS